eukprot:6569160-Prymnesium_polylepis.1
MGHRPSCVPCSVVGAYSGHEVSLEHALYTPPAAMLSLLLAGAWASSPLNDRYNSPAEFNVTSPVTTTINCTYGGIIGEDHFEVRVARLTLPMCDHNMISAVVML